MGKFVLPDLSGEVREGFYIRSMIKRVWSVQLDMLAEVDSLCKKYGIPYFADGGTLLGAVRHKGYIPWDDDIDLVFVRKDYMRFRMYAEKYFPERFHFLNDLNGEKLELEHHIVNGFSICTEPGYLDRNYGCPYVVGMDLFVLDEMPPEGSERELWLSMMNCGIQIAYHIEQESMMSDLSEEYREMVCSFEVLTGYPMKHESPIRSQILNVIEMIAASYSGSGARDLCMVPFLDKSFQREWYGSALDMEFEGGLLPVPVKYNEVLKTWYGEDYMIPKQGTAMHGYPGFAKQEKRLFEEYNSRGIPIPQEYRD